MKPKGLTIIEVLVAICALALAMTALNGLIVGNIVQNSSTGKLSQAINLMNYLGRRVSGSDSNLLPTSTSTPVTWGYGNLRTSFSDLPQGGNYGNPDLYRASVTNRGNWSNSVAPTITLTQYRIQVCWRTSQTTTGERCTQADTLGPNTQADQISN